MNTENNTTVNEAGAAPAASSTPAPPDTAAPAGEAQQGSTVEELSRRIDELLAGNQPAAAKETETRPAENAGKEAAAAANPDDTHTKVEQLEKQLAKLNSERLRDTAEKALAEADVPEELLALVDCTDKAAMEKSLELVKSTYQKGLEKAMKAKLAGKTPEGLGSTTTGQQLVTAQIEKNILKM